MVCDIPFFPSNDQHENGTQRCAEVASRFKPGLDVNVIVNWQGDEPCVDPRHVDRMLHAYKPGVGVAWISTLVSLATEESLADSNSVKVVVSRGRALWFSRAPMAGSLIHTGVYVFPPKMLRSAGLLSPTALGKAESLEQLPWIEDGMHVEVFQIDETPLAINTQDDLENFRMMIEPAQKVGKWNDQN
jgi:3-deoxy-manno-octulosonate cytidylyltransferase (CMP-KDO synthetase)